MQIPRIVFISHIYSIQYEDLLPNHEDIDKLAYERTPGTKLYNRRGHKEQNRDPGIHAQCMIVDQRIHHHFDTLQF